MNEVNPLSHWLSALCDRGTAFSVSLVGVPGRLRAQPHWAVRLDELDEHLAYFVAEGGFDAWVNGHLYRVTAGDLLWSGRGSRIDYRLREGETLVIWRFRLSAHGPNGHSLEWPDEMHHFASARTCEAWMERIVDEAAHPAPLGAARLRGLLLCLLTEMARLQGVREESSGTLARAQRESIERFFARNASRRVSPRDLANEVGLSPDYFSRCFRRAYGVSPRRWLTEERMRLAALRLLESSLNVSEVAREMGYADVFLFSRQFKQVMGLSPSRYRRQKTITSL